MSHREVKPHASLQQDVRCFWMLEDTQVNYNNKDIVPDPFVELVVNCGAPFVWESEDGTSVEMPRVYVNSLQTRPLRMKATGPVQCIFMRLYPWAAHPIIDAQTPVENSSIFVLDNKEWRDVATAIERTLRLHGYNEALQLLQEFAIGIYCREQMDIAPLRRAGRLLFATHGQVRMSELAASCYLSPSQFERRFKQLTHVSPKTYARIIRFRGICERLILNPAHQITALAQDFGYTDQAHLTHDFKAFAEQTPSEYAAHVRATPDFWRDAEFLQYT